MAENKLLLRCLAWLVCCAISCSAWAGRPVRVYEVDLKGGQTPALSLEGIGNSVEVKDHAEAKRFEAALVDGTGSTFTIVLTQQGKPPLELTFPRTGLAAAVKPLRSKCGW